MSEKTNVNCPECDDLDKVGLDRRRFLSTVGGAATALAVSAVAARTGRADEPKPADPKPSDSKKQPKPAEDLIKELFTNLDAEQKKQALLAYDEKGGPAKVKRLGMYNGSVVGPPIGKIYNTPQKELVERILKAIASDEAGYQQISRNGTWDNSKTMDNCGAHFFGDPTEKGDWCWLFSGHHITIRCDGNFSDGVGFGGPIYYGHSPNGYSDRNCFFYQTKRVLEFYEALDEKQRKKAVTDEKNRDFEAAVQFRDLEKIPGINFGELTKDQKDLVEKVMRDVLSPFRKEDADEVMQIVKSRVGFDKMHMAFHKDEAGAEKTPWQYWRLEGPGFVWNYRVLDHVHCYVNISNKG